MSIYHLTDVEFPGGRKMRHSFKRVPQIGEDISIITEPDSFGDRYHVSNVETIINTANGAEKYVIYLDRA